MYVMHNTPDRPRLPITDARDFLAHLEAALERPSEPFLSSGGRFLGSMRSRM